MHKKEKGAVTIFCIIVLSSIVMLGGLFIDGSRILLARQMMRSAMNSAARSALSYYDTSLVSEFGLYAVSEQDAKKQFERYFRNNMTLSQNDGFDLYAFELSDTPVTVKVSEPLSELAPFVDQVSEYSKYRAGIDLTIGVVNKIKMLFGENGAGNRVMGSTDDAQDALDALEKESASFGRKVDSQLSSAVRTQSNKAKEQLTAAFQQDMDDFSSSTIDALEQDVLGSLSGVDQTISQLEAQKNSYMTASEQANAQIDAAQNDLNAVEYWDEATGTWQTAAPDLTRNEDAPADPDSPDKQAEAMIEQAQTEKTKTMQRIKDNMQSIRDKAAQVEQHKKDIEQWKAQLSDSGANAARAVQALTDAQTALSRHQADHPTVCDPAETDEQLEQRLEKLRAQKTQLEQGGIALDPDLARDFPTREATEQAIACLEQEQTLRQQVKTAETDHTTASESDQALQQKIQSAEAQIEALVTEVGQLCDGMAAPEGTYAPITSKEEVSEADKASFLDSFQRTKTLLDSFYDSTIGELGKDARYVGDPNTAAKAKLDTPKFGLGIINELTGICDGLRMICTDPDRLLENMYLVEYALDKYTFLTSQSSRPSHYFKLGEVEYIIKGQNVQASDLSAVLGDILLLRLAINYVDDLIHTHSPEMVSRLLVALGRALIDTAQDLYQLLFEGGCGLCPSFSKVKLTYSDHLRLQLLMDTVSETSRTRMAGRMMTMIDRTLEVKDQDKAQHVDTLYTRLDATAEAKIDLIMFTLPLFGNMMPGQDIIKDGTFLLRETVSMGY